MSIRVTAEALLDVSRYIGQMSDVTRRAARLAINTTVQRKGIQAIRQRMAEQIAFPAGYLNDPSRLSVTRFASDTNLEAAITGRMQPTSLARFAIGGVVGARGGVTVQVKPGGARSLARAFLLRLRQGVVLDETRFNLGLAIRLRPGETITNKRIQTRQLGGLTLLYGPSVDQVFREVSVQVSPAIAADLASEYLRQFERLSRTP